MADGISFFLKVQDGFTNPLGSFYNKLARAQEPLDKLKRGLQNFNPKPNMSGMDNMSSSMNNASHSMDNMHGSMLKSMLEAQALGGAIGGIQNQFSGLIGEMNESSVSWQTFNGNLQMLGYSSQQIQGYRSEMQDYAQATIYSSSDMANTFSQFAATGIKGADGLVKGMGGLAASATDPKQAFKSLTEQGTQMAARPTVTWEDFRIMMQQTPGAMTQVAKSMGISMGQMQNEIHNGTLSTQDFFNAVNKVGNSKNYAQMATKFKTVGQAADGLRETIGNRFQNVFDSGSSAAINAINKIIDKVGSVNTDKMAQRAFTTMNSLIGAISNTFNTGRRIVGQFWQGLNSVGTIENVQWAIWSIRDSIEGMQKSSNKKSLNSLVQTIGSISGRAINGAANAIAGLVRGVSRMDPNTLKSMAGALAILKFGTKGLVFGGIVGFFNFMNRQSPENIAKITGVLKDFIGLLAVLKTFSIVGGVLGTIWANISKFRGMTGMFGKGGSSPMSKTPNVANWLKFGGAMLMVGGALVLAGTGMLIMAHAATTLASGGWMAIGVMVGMVAVIGLLAYLVSSLGPAMIAGSIGFAIFGGALLLIGAAVWVAAAGITMLATQLPTIAQYGVSAGLGLMMIGAGMAVAGAGALVGAVGAVAFGAAALILGAGLLVVGAGLVLVGTGLNVVASGVQNLYNVVSSIFGQIISKVSDLIGSFTDIGANLMHGLASGIKNTVGTVISAVTGIGSKITGKIKGILGIHSPSKVFAQYGNYLNQGMANGINHSNVASNAAGNMANDVATNGDPTNQNAPTSNPFTDNSDNSTTRSDQSRDNSIVIQQGAIQINGNSSNGQQTGKQVVAELENYLRSLQEGRLS